MLQDLPRIDAAILDGTFRTNPVLVDACRAAAVGDRRLALISLVGPGGVHANDRHLVALAEMAHELGVGDVVVHGLLDGRDTPPRSAARYLVDLESRLAGAHPSARIATVGGRYYAMDRDGRWDRVKRGYDAIVHGIGIPAASTGAAIAAAYARDEDDEFVQPSVITGIDGRLRDGDVVVHCNFRADRARQLTHALVDDDRFPGFDRGLRPRALRVITMTEYQAGLPVEVAFSPAVVPSLAQRASERGWRQFHVAETEKYAHVTYFFNGGVEAAWPGEHRTLIPSQRVATYDLAPAMSAFGVTDALVDAIESDTYDFIVANYANADMVGHSGVWRATIEALEVVDRCLGRVIDAVMAADAASVAAGGHGALLCVTADHGNADDMRDATGAPITAHSLNPVPIVVAGSVVSDRRLRDGVLADVAPTLLAIAGEAVIEGMTGGSLLESEAPPHA